MRGKFLCIVIFAVTILTTRAQITDSLMLREVVVTSYLNSQPLMRVPSSVAVLDSTLLNRQPDKSIVSVLNTVPGVRMEERSPGSYRLSLRGSLLRSPFGIRNVKVYLDEFPLTDAGGNTYLNLLDIETIKRIEIIKGPDGSLFGANSGGVVRMGLLNRITDSTTVRATITGGSYGYFHEYLNWQQRFKKGIFSLGQGWERSDGYRSNSALDRKYFQGTATYNYISSAQLKLLFFYSRLQYETPGALTLKEWNTNHAAARPATATLPGAEQQKAGIENNTLYGGIQNEVKFSPHVKHVVALFGTYTDFENPFITNYEVRTENTGGLRTWVEVAGTERENFKWKWNVGLEGSQTIFDISNYGNNGGIKDSLQATNTINTFQWFAFSRLALEIFNRLNVEVSASYNRNHYKISNSYPVVGNSSQRSFSPQWMPRIAASYSINKNLAWRASVSRGYSTPTIAEIRSSNNIVNSSLQPESGWNYETGFRLNALNKRIWWDASVFYYHLANAIVRRNDSTGNEFFVNAGQTNQRGVESVISVKIIKQSNTVIRSMELRNSYTLSNFFFSNYSIGENNFSGNRLTGVPQHIIVTALYIAYPLNFFSNLQYNYTSRLPLNDGNTVYANEYHLVDIKIGWQYRHNPKYIFEISGGVKNLLDKKYSLGNDLNPVNGRYYNAAPLRNYFVTLSACFN